MVRHHMSSLCLRVAQSCHSKDNDLWPTALAFPGNALLQEPCMGLPAVPNSEADAFTWPLDDVDDAFRCALQLAGIARTHISV